MKAWPTMIFMLLPSVVPMAAFLWLAANAVNAANAFDSGDIVIVVGAIGVVITNVIAALKTNKAIAAVAAKADVITGHVNSAATAYTTRIQGLEAQVTLLREMLTEKTLVAAVLAQSTADGKTAPAPEAVK